MSEKFVDMREIEPKTLRVMIPKGTRVIIHSGEQSSCHRVAVIATDDGLDVTHDDSPIIEWILGDDE